MREKLEKLLPDLEEYKSIKSVHNWILIVQLTLMFGALCNLFPAGYTTIKLTVIWILCISNLWVGYKRETKRRYIANQL